MKYSKMTIFGLALFFAVLLPVIAPGQSKQQNGGLVVVETKYVCMINNQRFAKEQIPVVVNGKTYFGCCEMCKAALKNKPANRLAVDPVSGKQVDKAKAVIGADSSDKVFYFENMENLKKFGKKS
jgi:YHS domain-containing protein